MGDFVPEGDWQTVGGGEVRYLRGAGEGALEVRFQGLKDGHSIRVLPDDLNSGKTRRAAVTRALTHLGETTRLRRLNADDKSLWLIGFLWQRGFANVVYHVDLSHRI